MKIFTDFDLTDFNSYRIRARCKCAFFPESEKDIIELYRDQSPLILLGSGHNVILTKEEYRENFVIFNGNYGKISIDSEKNIIEAEAGAHMLEISELACKNGLSGVEVFYDIPSSFGGAVVMNAGASGEEIKDLLLKVRYLDLVDLKIKEIDNKDVGFKYRDSFFQRNTDKIVLKGWLQLEEKPAEDIREKMERVKTARWEKQPKDFPNAGSVFKRPSGYYVGAIMDDLGLKGFTVGGAMISQKHGGFIINHNNASGQDIINLIEEVKRRVWEAYQIVLEVEQRLI